MMMHRGLRRVVVRFLAKEKSAESRLAEAVARLEAHSQEWTLLKVREMLERKKRSEEEEGAAVEPLEHAWWRLERRMRRSPRLGAWVTSFAAGWLARFAGIVSDGRFEEGATAAFEALHDAVAEGDEEALARFCDAPLASSLGVALREARDAGLRVEHGCRVLGRPRIAWWRVFVGLERSSATWETRDGAPSVVDDWCALDARAGVGLALVLPRDEFGDVETAVKTNSVNAVYNCVSQAMDDHTVSLQAAVDFPSVREALVAWTGDGSKAGDYWSGSTAGYVVTHRQLIFETPAYRKGTAVDEPEWRLVDVDGLMDGGAPYWRHAIVPST